MVKGPTFSQGKAVIRPKDCSPSTGIAESHDIRKNGQAVLEIEPARFSDADGIRRLLTYAGRVGQRSLVIVLRSVSIVCGSGNTETSSGYTSEQRDIGV